MLRVALVETSYVDAMGIYSCLKGIKVKCQPFDLCSQFISEQRLKPFDALIIEIVPFEYGLSGALDTLQLLKVSFPNLPVIVLTRSEDPYVLSRVMSYKTYTILSKQEPLSVLREAIMHHLFSGAVVRSDAIRRFLEKSMGLDSVQITRSEERVMSCLQQGQSIGEIARRLKVSEKTISGHKRSAMRKLGLTNHANFCRYLVSHKAVLVGERT